MSSNERDKVKLACSKCGWNSLVFVRTGEDVGDCYEGMGCPECEAPTIGVDWNTASIYSAWKD